MGLVTAFNAVLECVVTGLVTSLCILGFAKLGWLPILFLSTDEPPEEDDVN